MIKEKILAKGASWLLGAKAFAIANMPTALVAAGVGFVIWAIVETAKAASEPNDEIEQAIGELEEANETLIEAKTNDSITDEQIKECKKIKKHSFRVIGKEIFKQYKKTIILATIGLSAFVGGYLWVVKRFTLAAAEAAATSATLATLDKNCRKTFGDNLTNAMYYEDFDIDKYEKAATLPYKEDGTVSEVGNISTEAKSYTTELIGDEDDPEKNIYHWNKNTVEDDCFNQSFEYRVIWLKYKLGQLQNELDNNIATTYLPRDYILKQLGLHSATVHPLTPEGEKMVDDDMRRGVCKGDKIDIGCSELFEELDMHRSDPDWIKYLEEKYQDIIIHLNVTYDALRRAKTYDETTKQGVTQRKFLSYVPKRFKNRHATRC